MKWEPSVCGTGDEILYSGMTDGRVLTVKPYTHRTEVFWGFLH